MKKTVILALAMALVLIFSACGAQAAGQSAQNNSSGGSRGIVTAVSDNQIEIAKMEGGNRQGNARPSGDNQNGGARPSGQPSGGSGAQPSMDTSKMEKVKYTIDSNTKIILRKFETQDNQSQNQNQNQSQGQRQMPKTTETAGTISDITTGTVVEITTQQGKDSLAAEIIITSGMGLRGNPQQGAPSGSSTPQAGTSTSAA